MKAIKYPADPRPWVKYIANCRSDLFCCSAQNYIVVAQSEEGALDIARGIHRWLTGSMFCINDKIQLRKISDLTPEEWQEVYDYEKLHLFDNSSYWFRDNHISWPEHVKK